MYPQLWVAALGGYFFLARAYVDCFTMSLLGPTRWLPEQCFPVLSDQGDTGKRFPPCPRSMLRVLLGFLLAMRIVSLSWEAIAAEPATPPLPVDQLAKRLPLNDVPLGLPKKPPLPPDNRLSRDRAKLGRRLFFDPVLSVDCTVSCASCHDPRHGFAGPLPLAIGIGGARGRRHPPSLLNRVYGTTFFWDGRATTLEEQALQPISNPKEMGSNIDELLRRLGEDANYREAFAAAYEGGITAGNLAKALASFQRLLLSGNSPVDRFVAGDVSALTTRQRQGLWLFESRAGCWQCHSGKNYTDESFHNTGVSLHKQPVDRGRFEVTARETDLGRFKTPSLRSVALTAPYMHDGSLPTLRAVVEFYNRGGTKGPNLDPGIKPLNLSSEQIESIVSLLEALSGTPLGTNDSVNDPERRASE